MKWALAAVAALIAGASSSKVAKPWGQCGGIGAEKAVCPEGYYCDIVNENYSQCAKDYSSSESKSASKGISRRQAGYTPVTGPQVGGIVPRQPLARLQADTDVFNMFILGLSQMMALRETNELSYYQLAGIHGLPHIPWGQPASDDQDTDYGYCTHASGLFATWHRPYLSLIEQRIVAHAISEAKKFQGADKQRYLAAAKRVRIPYWDWAVDNSAIPAIVKQPMISVIRPGKYGRNGTKTERVDINNPLYSYRFTDDALKNEYFSGFYIQAPETLRQPTDAYTSHQDVADATMQRNYAARRQNTYNLFSIPSFAEFSSTAFSAGGVPNAWTSVESIHNQVHGSLGGTTPGLQGHMALVDYSSFDPIFWLHHAQVDRLAAMYQAVFPGRVVTPQPATGVFARKIKDGDMDTIDTPLWPFKKPNGQYYTSRDFSDAGSIWQYGYEYPEVPASYQGRERELVSFTTGQINALYSPSATVAKREEAANSTRTEWLCHFVFIPAEVGATAMLEIYLDGEDFTTVDSNSTTDDGYVGAGAALGRMTYTEHDKRMRITATVPLTYKLEEDKIDINDPAAVVKYLKDNLRWSMQKGQNETYDLSKIPSLKVGVSSAEVTYGGPNDLPTWGNFTTYYEITESKKCGMTDKDNKMVGSDDAPRYHS